jgi:hypothetical protein
MRLAPLPFLLVAWLPLVALGELVCDEAVYDFGVVDGSDAIVHEFVLENRGEEAVPIKKVHAPCGCTVARVNETEVPAGGSLKVPVTLDLRGRTGFQQKSVFIETGGSRPGRSVLTLRGRVGGVLAARPPMLVARSAGGGPPEGSVEIVGGGSEEFRITGVESQRGVLQPVIEGARIKAVASEELPPGNHADVLVVTTDHPSASRFEVKALALVPADVTVAPSVLRLPPNDAVEAARTIMVKAGGGRSLTIEEVELPVEGMTSGVAAMPGGAFRVTIGGIRPTMDLIGKKVLIRTGGEVPRVLEVPIDVHPTQRNTDHED